MIPQLAEEVTFETTLTTQETWQRVKVNGLVTLLKGTEMVTVLVVALPVMSYRLNDRETLKSVAAQLLNTGLVTISEAICAFGLPRSTLRDAQKNLEEQGVKGLVPKKRGPKGAWKLVTRTRRLVLDTAYEHPEWKMPQITTHVNQCLQEEGLKTLSEGHLRRFLTFCGVLPRQEVAKSSPELTEIRVPDKSQTPQSTGGDFPETLPEIGQDEDLDGQDVRSGEIVPAEVSSPLNEATQSSGPQVDSKAESPESQPSPTVFTAADHRYLARLRKGVDTAFGGGFLVMPFLLLIQFPSLVTRGLAGMAGGYYTSVQLVLTFFFLALFGVPTLEAVKMLVKGELGVLLGRRRSPGLTKLRSFLKTVSQLGRAEALALVAACCQIQAGVVDWQVLFIDGHFIPYYGGHRIRKGYFTTHRMALRGNEAYYANDLQGRPLFFLFMEACTSLITALPEIVQQVKQIAGDRWLDWCLTLIFDRGGFCAKLFKTLDDLKVYWVTWLKVSSQVEEQIYQVEEERFQLYLIRLKSRKTKVKLCEWKVDITGYGLCRAIILLDLKTGKRMVIITNDQTRTLQEVAQLMLQRWSQENFFKVMMSRYHLDYTPGHQFELAQEDPLVSNPRLKELRSLKRRLKTMKQKLESQLAQRLLARKRDQVTLQDYKDDHDEKVRAVKSLEREIERVKDELAQTPDKIPFSQAFDQPLEVSNLERKRFLDVLKGLAFNAEEWLLERLKPYYHGKDVRQALLQILFRGAVVQLVDGVLYVHLKPFDSSKVQAAAEELCQELNSLSAHTLDKFRFPIVYDVLPP